jgi:hypothetical protein
MPRPDLDDEFLIGNAGVNQNPNMPNFGKTNPLMFSHAPYGKLT